MDRHVEELEQEVIRLLLQAAEAAVALDRAKGTIRGVPHYSVIELRAHELGQQLSREIQQKHLAAMVSEQSSRTGCPGCGTDCDLEPDKRTVTSIDGAVTVPELQGYCRRCRRAFFPPQGSVGL